MPRGGLRCRIPGCERKGLAAHRVGLRGVVGRKPHAPELDPYQGIVWLDAQRTLESGCRLGGVAASGLLVSLGDERARR